MLFPVISAQQILYQGIAAAFVIATHGFLLAAFARLLGDRGPGYDGRLTLNPLTHAEGIGTLVLVLAQFGWIRPIDIGVAALKGRVFGLFAMVAGALAASLALAWGLWQLRPLIFSVFPDSPVGVTLIGLIETTCRTSIGFVLFNLLPLPPLTAGHILTGLAPAVHAWLTRYRFFVGVVLAVPIVSGLAWRVLATPIRQITAMLLN